jgi:hypothetical protein
MTLDGVVREGLRYFRANFCLFFFWKDVYVAQKRSSACPGELLFRLNLGLKASWIEPH